MEFKVENFSVEPLSNGVFQKLFLAKFSLNNQPRTWEIVKSHDSVAVLIYNKDSKSFVLVKQFRPPVFFNNKKDGVTYELCAGLLDKDCSIEQTTKEEILEECGFDVPLESIDKITSFYSSVGSSGSKQHLFFCQVDEGLRVNSGGGVDGEEQIEVVELPINIAKDFIFNEEIPKTPGLMFAFEWYFNR